MAERRIMQDLVDIHQTLLNALFKATQIQSTSARQYPLHKKLQKHSGTDRNLFIDVRIQNAANTDLSCNLLVWFC